MWKPVAGKYGRTRGGDRMGPMEPYSDPSRPQYKWQGRSARHPWWTPKFTENGAYFSDDECDLVAEWTDEDDAAPAPDSVEPVTPVRTITITIADGKDFTVAENGLLCDRMNWDEMLGHVAVMTMPDRMRSKATEGIYGMRTPEEIEARRAGRLRSGEVA